MTSRAYVTYKGDATVKKRAFNASVKEALQEAVKDWYKNILPGHFTESGRRKYRYRARSRKYRARKRKRFGHDTPLVFTGDLKRQAMRRVRPSGTKKSARGSMVVPRYAYTMHHGVSRPADEMVEITKKESLQLAKIVDKEIGKRLKKAK
jgi:hypothetical protein